MSTGIMSSGNQPSPSVTPRPTGESAPVSPRVTQEMLAAYAELREVTRELRKVAGELREEIMNSLEQGGEVEPGPLTAEIRTAEQQRFSLAKLSRLLGEQRAQELQSQIEPTVSRALWVLPARQGAAGVVVRQTAEAVWLGRTPRPLIDVGV